jgi:hypothetical protein
MKPTKYFILNEQDGDLRHIATIKATNDKQLNNKIKEAVTDHFSCTTVEIDDLTMAEISHTHSGSFGFIATLSDPDGDQEFQNIEIIETVLY